MTHILLHHWWRRRRRWLVWQVGNIGFCFCRQKNITHGINVKLLGLRVLEKATNQGKYCGACFLISHIVDRDAPNISYLCFRHAWRHHHFLFLDKISGEKSLMFGDDFDPKPIAVILRV